ncbi:MAG: zf-TFIIB domain-containing protein [Alphaproteobacteria bacterium]|nr:zf-TFIIB domain-containing protein [Alphaproteobacteria bacterium]MDA8029870.1 zf-TFIIB domain-containing protein [Alphaproteobacteria bacterium]
MVKKWPYPEGDETHHGGPTLVGADDMGLWTKYTCPRCGHEHTEMGVEREKIYDCKGCQGRLILAKKGTGYARF